MKKVRISLLVALLVSLAILTALWEVNFTGWVVYFENVAMIVLGFFSLAVIALMVATLFPVKDGDLWKTAYFRYMRALWKERWGGHCYPLQISVCRATWLSVLTFVAWLSAICLVGWFIYALMATIGWPWSDSFLQTLTGSEGSFAGCMIASILAFFVMIVLMLGLFWNEEIDHSMPKFYKAGFVAAGVSVAVILALLFIALPIVHFGAASYFIFIGIVIGGTAAIIGIAYFIKKGIPRLSRFFAERTVPGVLVSGSIKGFKEKVCPLIVQKWPENKT